MPVGVIDLLEVIQIQKEHCQALPMTLHPCQHLLQLVHQQHAVGELRQSVMVGELPQPLLILDLQAAALLLRAQVHHQDHGRNEG